MLLTEFINTKCFVDLKGKKISQNLRVCKEYLIRDMNYILSCFIQYTIFL